MSVYPPRNSAEGRLSARHGVRAGNKPDTVPSLESDNKQAQEQMSDLTWRRTIRSTGSRDQEEQGSAQVR